MAQYYNKDGIIIYNDDNLNVLRATQDETVNLIYCDVLYNTGKKFDDYSDDLGSPKEATLWYRPRIEEMKRVLTSNGSIFIHCNWRLDSYLRILMDEIFGTECFRNRIYRKHSEERGFYSNFDSQVDIILYYVKNPDNFVFHEMHDLTKKLIPLFENGFMQTRSENRILGSKEINLAEKNKHWLVSPKQFENMVLDGEVVIIEGLPYRFTNVKAIGNLWSENDMLDTYLRTDLAEAYDTPKPEAILHRIISICTNPGDTVADFFMGGGTTAVVAKKLGRKGIFCDISPKACQIATNKLKAL